jgi:hypothetical protein
MLFQWKKNITGLAHVREYHENRDTVYNDTLLDMEKNKIQSNLY